MKEQINKFARGVFEYNPLQIILKDNSINAIIDKNRGYNGAFSFSEINGRTVRGVVYSNSDKVVLLKNVFSGSQVEITFTVNCENTLDGDIIEGQFDLISNAGEYEIPYSFRVEPGSHATSMGQVRNLFQFAELAKTRTEEAVKVFETSDFENVYIGDNIAQRCIYEGLKKGPDVRNNMEEFLIAVHKKNSINITFPTKEAYFEDVTESFKDVIPIERDTWGFADVNVYTDAPFIRLERTLIDSDLFAGNTYDFAYIVDADKLHYGKNFGKIVFETIGKKSVFSITVSKKCEKEITVNPNRAVARKAGMDLTELYIAFRTHKINISDWMRESQIVIERMREIDDTNPFYRLALAHIYIAGQKMEEAKELIENVKDEIAPDDFSKYPIYCYFIYINTLYNRDRIYSRKASSIVKECFRQCEDWRVLWTLMFMDEELEQNPSLKLLRIKEQFNKGCTSPTMYIEACNILNEQPVLLRVLNSFEINVLIFGARNGILDKKLRDIAAGMLLNAKNGSEGSIRLLRALYEVDKDVAILESLCKLLIRNGKLGDKYIDYYEKAIEAELKITQLFEFYLMSRKTDDMTPLPKMLLMYFGYNNSLDYRKKAYLYSNIIHNRNDNIQVFNSYLPQIELFVERQLMAGHINRQLAYIYSNIVTPQMVSNDNAGQISEIYFTYMIECNNPSVKNVIIRHKESNSEKEYALKNGEAYVKIYTQEPAIIFQTEDGSRYCYGVNYKVTRLLEDDIIIRKCLMEDAGLIHANLSFCEKLVKYQKKTMEEVESMIELSRMPELNRFYRKILVTSIVDFYYDYYDSDGFDNFIGGVNVDTLDEKTITKILEIYIIQGRYRDAYRLVDKASASQIMPKRLMKLCSKLVAEGETGYSDTLCRLCIICFKKGQYDDGILEYLLKYYNGSLKDMTKLWQSMLNLPWDLYELEERIICQMLFASAFIPEIYDIFDDYYSKGPNDRIVEAYLAYMSYEYFVRGKDVDVRVFDIIESTLENEKSLTLVCKMALLLHYTFLEELSEFRKDIAYKAIMELVRKSYIFPFFTSFSGKIPLPYEVTDKTMVEYRTNPENKVVIHYVFEDIEHKKNYVSAEMKNVYEGIFVGNFVLFYGESLKYYISEETKDGEIVSPSKTIVEQQVQMTKSQGRYELLNDILAARSALDRETLDKLIHSYAVSECVTEQVFKPL